MSFPPGTPVLIINGATKPDCKLIGHATVVRSQHVAYLPPEDIPVLVHLVTESKDFLCRECKNVHMHYVYRTCDLMPIHPLDDEREVETKTPVYIEVTHEETE